MSEYKPTVDKFAAVMLEKMEANKHKGEQWKTMSVDSLLKRVLEEFEELQLAVTHDVEPHFILREAADIANQAMMVADRYERNYVQKEQKNG